MDISLAAVGKVVNKKTAKSNLDSLRSIKSWIGIFKIEDSIKRLKVQMELDDSLYEVISMYQPQRIKKKLKIMADIMDLALKDPQKLRIKGGG